MKRMTAARSLLLRPGVTVSAGALAGNLALLAGGRAVGASFAVADRGEPGSLVQIGPAAVALSTLLPLMIGLAATAVLVRRWPRTHLALKVLAVVITLASLGMPLSAATDTGTRILLTIMHLVVGGAYLVAQRGATPASLVAAQADAEAAPAGSAR